MSDIVTVQNIVLNNYDDFMYERGTDMNEIAIASVPVQKWEEPYQDTEALKKGSIFPQLNKPFFIEEEMKECEPKPQDESEAKLLEIQQLTFFLIDLTLYLDTHPEDTQAKLMRQDYQQRRKEALAKFAKEHYPLTMDCEGDQCKAPIPWEGGKKNVAL